MKKRLYKKIYLGVDIDKKYTKYKICLNLMMLIFFKPHLSKFWSSNHEKVKQHWSRVEKSVYQMVCKRFTVQTLLVTEICDPNKFQPKQVQLCKANIV